MRRTKAPHHFVGKRNHAINNGQVTPEKSLILFRASQIFGQRKDVPKAVLYCVVNGNPGLLLCPSRPNYPEHDSELASKIGFGILLPI